MIPTTPSPTRCTLIVLTLALLVMTLFVPHALAADPALTAHDAPHALPAVLPAFDMMDIVHDRGRLIQFSIGAVALGIALLWWGNKTN